MIEFKWKPITEIPTEHWDGNQAISPRYLVKCEGQTYDGLPIIGYTHYSFVANKWIDCFNNTADCYNCNDECVMYKVIAWTDVKL